MNLTYVAAIGGAVILLAIIIFMNSKGGSMFNPTQVGRVSEITSDQIVRFLTPSGADTDSKGASLKYRGIVIMHPTMNDGLMYTVSDLKRDLDRTDADLKQIAECKTKSAQPCDLGGILISKKIDSIYGVAHLKAIEMQTPSETQVKFYNDYSQWEDYVRQAFKIYQRFFKDHVIAVISGPTGDLMPQISQHLDYGTGETLLTDTDETPYITDTTPQQPELNSYLPQLSVDRYTRKSAKPSQLKEISSLNPIDSPILEIGATRFQTPKPRWN